MEVYSTKKKAEEEMFRIFKIAKQMTRTNQDVVEEKCIRNYHGDFAFGDCGCMGKLIVHCLTRSFVRDNDSLSFVDPKLGPAVTREIEDKER